jgi:uncharacterized protein YkwD
MVRFSYSELFLALGLGVASLSLFGCGGGGSSTNNTGNNTSPIPQGDGSSTNNTGNNTSPIPQKAVQTITGLPSGTVENLSSIDLPKTTNAGLPISYSVSTPNTCMVSNFTLQVTNTGKCTVAYTQNGDTTYAPLNANLSLDVSRVNYYELPPSVKDCKFGVINDKTRESILAEVNDIRKLHGLEPLVYNKDFEKYTNEAALAVAAQNLASHNIDSTWNCYSENASYGAKYSSLYRKNSSLVDYQVHPTDAIVSFMRENTSDSLGHRRWMLDPFVKETAFGLADGEKKVGTGYTYGAALYMLNPATHIKNTTTSPLGIYPYPVGNYPRKYFQKGDRLSLFILYDQSTYFKNSFVDYSKTTITIKDDTGKQYSPTGILFDTQSQGVPNNLSFLFPDFEYGVNYTVNLDNVTVNGQVKNYQYSFKVD